MLLISKVHSRSDHYPPGLQTESKEANEETVNLSCSGRLDGVCNT